MDKKELRQKIRQQKREMTQMQIQTASEKLGELFAASPLYPAFCNASARAAYS